MQGKPMKDYDEENLPSAAKEYGDALFTDQARYEFGNPNTVPWDWGNKWNNRLMGYQFVVYNVGNQLMYIFPKERR